MWPGDIATTKPDCTGLTPTGFTCELITNFRIRLTIPSATEEINGAIGGMKLPFSMNPLKLNSISYRSSTGLGCAKQTADYSSTANPRLTSGMSFTPRFGAITNAQLTAETPADYAIVGDASIDNSVKFVITPASTFSVYGGMLSLSGPPWYDSKRFKDYYWGVIPGFACVCAQFTKMTGASKSSYDAVSNEFVSTYEIHYDGIKTTKSPKTLAAKDPITIECSYWRNPVIPQAATGFRWATFDFAASPKAMDVSDPFTVQAAGGAAYTPSPIPASAITYTVSHGAGEAKPTIQSLSTYTISVTSPVPLEIAATGCYLEVEFPRELQM